MRFNNYNSVRLFICLFCFISSFLYGQNSPVITSNGGGSTASISFAENTASAVTTVTSSDVDAGATADYSISGTDVSVFDIDGTSGVLTFKSAPDFETKIDSNTDNDYIVIV